MLYLTGGYLGVVAEGGGSSTGLHKQSRRDPTSSCAVQHLYLEHNELRELPGGQWWSRLHVLSLDWEPLLRSGHALLASVRVWRWVASGAAGEGWFC